MATTKKTPTRKKAAGKKKITKKATTKKTDARKPRGKKPGAEKTRPYKSVSFHLERTTSNFGVFNPREEKNKGAAFDLPFSVTVPASILSMLIPSIDEFQDDAAIIDELFSAEGHVTRPALNPIAINRKPEGATVTIWDQEKFAKPMVLKPCNLNKLKVELQTPHQVVLTGQIQHSKYNDKELVRINALMNKAFDIEIKIEQMDLFSEPPSEPEKDTKDTKK